VCGSLHDAAWSSYVDDETSLKPAGGIEEAGVFLDRDRVDDVSGRSPEAVADGHS
jgi:hypothetical protein